MTRPSSRQELYDRIRESSQDNVILEEMIRLGFWPQAGVLPEDPGDEIRRRGELEGRLRALRTEQSRLRNIDALKKEARKRRMAESRQKQKETKERRLRERRERAEAWRERKTREIVYLGEGVSAGLADAQLDAAKLARYGLPSFADAAAIARAMGLSMGELRRFAFTRTTSKTTNYVRFSIPKRTGGERRISAPLPRLKEAQRWILDKILAIVPLHEAAHGFVNKRSIVSNARPHLSPAVVVNVDLQDFFPTVSYRRVKGLFRSFGYSEHVATIFGLLCSEPQVTELELDGQTYYVGLDGRVLPQGAPTSPAITNLICRTMDRRLTSVAAELGFRFTRYADDLSFSAEADDADAGRLLRRVRHVVDEEGFTVHPDKTRVLRRGRRQEVTGIVVNGDRPSISRDVLRRFRATLFQLEKDGPAGKRWGAAVADDGDDVIAAVEGFANYVAMVDPEKGAPLRARAAELVRRHGKKPPPAPRGGGGGGGGGRGRTRATPESTESTQPTESTEPTEPTEPTVEKKKKKKWWKVF